MRYACLLLILFFCAQVQAQDRIFRASSIDIEQNERLDSLEARLAALESSRSAAPAKILPPQTKPPQLQIKPKPVPRSVAQVVVQQAAPVRQSARYALSELRAIIQRLRPGGWRGPVYADVSPRSMAKNHLVSGHGFSWDQVSGLSQNEALILHDLAHGGRVYATRTRTTTTQTVQYSNFGTQQRANAGCANGQCANPSSSYSSYSRNKPPILRSPLLQRIFR